MLTFYLLSILFSKFFSSNRTKLALLNDLSMAWFSIVLLFQKRLWTLTPIFSNWRKVGASFSKHENFCLTIFVTLLQFLKHCCTPSSSNRKIVKNKKLKCMSLEFVVIFFLFFLAAAMPILIFFSIRCRKTRAKSLFRSYMNHV